MNANFTAMILAAAMSIFGGGNETTLEKLNHALQHMGNRGDVGYQAQLDGFDYRENLRRVIRGKRDGLGGLFDYSLRGRLRAEAAEQHAEILYNLLRLSGDDLFASVLQTRPPVVQRRVVSLIDSRFPNPGWPLGLFPETYRLGPHARIPSR